MAECVLCGGDYSAERAILGYDLCLDCGEQEAQNRREELKEQSTPLYNKGPYQLITKGTNLKDVGRK